MADKTKSNSLKHKQRILAQNLNVLKQLTVWNKELWDINKDQDPRGKNVQHLIGSPEKELLWAAAVGNLNLVKSLVTKHPHLVNVQDEDGYTALHNACNNNHVAIVKFLLENKADPNIRTDDSITPLHCACSWSVPVCPSLLIEEESDINAVTNGG